jgi:uncharacterized membrane protein
MVAKCPERRHIARQGKGVRASAAADSGPASIREPSMNSPTPASGGFDANRPTIIAILYLASWVTGSVAGIVGGVLAFVWKNEPHEAWVGTHYEYLINTFWIALIGTIVGVLLTVTIILSIIGIPLIFGVGIWTTVRSIMSLMNAQKQQPMPNPGSWGI